MATFDGYIDLPITTDVQAIVQQALGNIVSKIPGWTPSEGNLEVLLLEEFASMAAVAADSAHGVPASIFKYFGSLVGLTQNTGSVAQIRTTWKLFGNAPSSGFFIPAGTQAGLNYNGASYIYSTVSDTTIASGSSNASIVMQAVTSGAEYNLVIAGLNPLTTNLSLTAPNPFVQSITITATPSTDTSLTAGVDAESDSVYLNRLSAELQLLAPRPITPVDYSDISSNTTGVYRALALDGFNPYTNLLTQNDANLTSAIYNNYTAVGNGTASVPTLAFDGSQSTKGLDVTAVALSSTVPSASVSLGATTVTVVSAVLSTTTSNTNPSFVLVQDPANGSEIICVTAVGGSSNKTWTLLSGTSFKYAHSTSASLIPLQGAVVPNVSQFYPNSSWAQAAAIVKANSENTATATPYVVVVTTGANGEVNLYSSCNALASSLYDYTTLPKTVVANFPTTCSGYVAPFRNDGTTTYNSIHDSITSVQMYVLWANATSTKTHSILYASISQSGYDFSSGAPEDPASATSDYNSIPDPELNAYYTPGTYLSSWTLDSGINALPGFGIQFKGTGSALGSALNAKSQIFNLPNVFPTGTIGNFTAFATIDATFATSTYSNIVLSVVDISTGTPTTLGSQACTSNSLQTVVIPFTLSASAKDLYVQVQFGAGLNVPNTSSVVVSSIALFPGTYSSTQAALVEVEPGFIWTVGGQYTVNSFNYPRSVVVAPVDSLGFPVSDSVTDSLQDYLTIRREANFQVYTIQPNFVQINVYWSALAEPGYDPSILQSKVNAAINSFLSPANWAGGLSTPPYWDSTQNVIRILDVAGIISGVTGISNVTSVALSIPGMSVPAVTDILMPGIAPLPIANTVSGAVISNSLNSTLGGI